MKKWIHASSSDKVQRISILQNRLAQYNSTWVDLVKRCQEEMMRVLHEDYPDEDDQEWININLNAIKTDYLMDAEDRFGMTEIEFEDIFNTLDSLDMEFDSSVIDLD